MEAARAFERLMDEFQLTQEQVAERTGKDRATVANAVRLLKLEPIIQDWIEEGKLTAGHGRGLLAVQDPKMRMRFAQRAARGGLTVRQIERLASRRSRGTGAPAEFHMDANIRAALEELQRHLGHEGAAAAEDEDAAGAADPRILRRRPADEYLRPLDALGCGGASLEQRAVVDLDWHRAKPVGSVCPEISAFVAILPVLFYDVHPVHLATRCSFDQESVSTTHNLRSVDLRPAWG